MQEQDKLDIAAKIVEKILPSHFDYKHSYTETSEDGNVFRAYTDRTQAIFDQIIEILNEY